MSHKGTCKRCGKERWVWDADGICSTCHQEIKQEKIQKDFDDFYKDAEEGETFDTWSDEFVICPYCGYAIPTDLGYEDFPELYEDGGHDIDCPECEKSFVLETSVSYSWETKKKEGE